MFTQRIIVKRPVPDAQGFCSDLEQQEWVFYFFEDQCALVVDKYAVYERKTKRHKWTAKGEVYVRVGHDRSIHHMAEKDVPLPIDVIAAAKKEFFLLVRVCKWEDRYAKA